MSIFSICFRRTFESHFENGMLNENEKSILLAIAHDAVETVVQNKKFSQSDRTEKNLSEPGGAFVTLYVHDQLRGCIGYVQPVYSLARTVQTAAIKAAVEDFRFPSIQKKELDDVKINISVIGEQRIMSNIDDIIIGEDGIMIEYGSSKGLLLPHVAIEWEWDREEFLNATCHKAGLPDGSWKNQHAEVILFKTENFGEHTIRKTGANENE